VSSRCQTASGDFFAAVPVGDAYIMKNIIHDWSDEKALSILQNCHRAGKGKAKVILVEAVITPGNEPHFAKWLDLEMLLLPGGRERTEVQFAQLFEQAGFRLTRVVQTKSPVCVLEAEKRG
jgi:O-methyltransferase domain